MGKLIATLIIAGLSIISTLYLESQGHSMWLWSQPLGFFTVGLHMGCKLNK